MRVTCPSCTTDFPLEAGLIEADGKRLAAQMAGMEPMLGRAVIGYLRLFKPAKTGLRNARAVKIVAELEVLIAPGSVCADERGGIRRTATPALWAAGIEQMLATPPSGLPLANHNYLRRIVFGLADRAADAPSRTSDAVAPVATVRRGPSPAGPEESPLDSHLGWLRQQLAYEQIDQAEFDRRAAVARQRFGGAQP